MEWLGVFATVSVLLVVLSSYLDTTARIRRLEHKLNLLLKQSGIDMMQGAPLSDRVKDLARNPANKIQAIKVYREETGMGLKEAKDAVEAFMNSQ